MSPLSYYFDGGNREILSENRGKIGGKSGKYFEKREKTDFEHLLKQCPRYATDFLEVSLIGKKSSAEECIFDDKNITF